MQITLKRQLSGKSITKEVWRRFALPPKNERGEMETNKKSFDAFPQFDGLSLSGGGVYTLECLMRIRTSVEARLKALGVAEQDIEDVSMECLYGVAQKISFYNPNQGSFDAWVSGFIKNAARAWRAKARRQASLTLSLSDLARQRKSGEISMGISEALLELEDSEKHLLILRFSAVKSSPEIAEMLGLTAIVVRKRVSRAVEKLRSSESVQALLA